MEITASQVKELREKTGVGLMDCKKALSESNGNLDEAIKYLRNKGLSAASKKADRTTNEGRIFISTTPQSGSILELNCETDFVAKNTDFAALGNSLSSAILTNKIGDNQIENINQTEISNYILKLGENISIKQFKTLTSNGSISSYIHSNGKIGVLVAFSDVIDPDLGRDIAMHIAAADPQYISSSDVPDTEIENEKAIILNQSQNSGKPQNVIDKIVEGRLNKFFKEICLVDQAFIKDDKESIKNILPKNTTVSSFIRFSLV